jgi:hypothetical protein
VEVPKNQTNNQGLAAAMPLGYFRMILINTFKNNRYQAGLTGYVVRIFKNTKCQHLVTGYVARIFYLLKATSNKRLKLQATSNKHVAGCQVLALDNLGL